MDARACWRMVAEELTKEETWEDALFRLDDLCGWLEKGGYRPEGVPFANQLRTFQRVLEAVQRERQLHVNPDL